MLDQKQLNSIEPRIRTIMILSGSLIMGVVVATGLAAMIADWGKANYELSLMVWVGIAFTAITSAASLIVPGMVAQSSLAELEKPGDKDDSKMSPEQKIDRQLGVFQTKSIIRSALIEGACFLNLIGFFLEVSLISLILVGFGVLLMAVFFPTPGRIIEFVEENVS